VNVKTLLVDDSEPFRMLLRKRLEPIGCEIVAEASSSQEGLELFRQYNPQLVTLDLIMPDSPDFGSKALFEKIREENPETAIIVISVQSRYANAAGFLSQGAIAYLEKSFVNFDDMHQKLKRVFPEMGRSGSNAWDRIRRRD
jgi:two-component system, chemotaxis family, chemotaxis protein CheY